MSRRNLEHVGPRRRDCRPASRRPPTATKGLSIWRRHQGFRRERDQLVLASPQSRDGLDGGTAVVDLVRVHQRRTRRIDTERIRRGPSKTDRCRATTAEASRSLGAQDQPGERKRAARTFGTSTNPPPGRARQSGGRERRTAADSRPASRSVRARCTRGRFGVKCSIARAVERHVETGAEIVDLRAVTVENETDEIHRRRPRPGGTGREREGPRVEVQHGANERSASGGNAGRFVVCTPMVAAAERRPSPRERVLQPALAAQRTAAGRSRR